MTQVAKRKREVKTEDQILAEMETAEDGGRVEALTPGATITFRNSIAVPMQDPDYDTYVGRHSGRVDARLERGKQVENFRKLYSALKLNNYRLENGRHVDSAADVFKWLMENARPENPTSD